MENGVSIILCCYNSGARLPVTLCALNMVAIPDGVAAELLLVDNNSTDNTVEVALTTWGEFQSPIPLKIVSESRQGLGYARIKGAETAKFGYIFFVDDDNAPAPDYLQKAIPFLHDHPEVGILGGINHGVFEAPLPPWIEPGFPFKSLLSSLAVSTPEYSTPGYLDAPEAFLAGAGLVLRKAVFDPVLRFDYQTMLIGRIGNQLLSGDDEELNCYAKLMGFRLFRADFLHLNHHIAPARIQKPYFERLFFGFGYSSLILKAYRQVLSGNFTIPDPNAIKRKSALKILMFSLAHHLLNPILPNKAFKLKLLIQFQQGTLQYLADRPQLAEVYHKIHSLANLLKSN
jgi:glycosyltransferase involved in cell wall biosynthesis